jgi:hypothetical protein
VDAEPNRRPRARNHDARKKREAERLSFAATHVVAKVDRDRHRFDEDEDGWSLASHQYYHADLLDYIDMRKEDEGVE